MFAAHVESSPLRTVDEKEFIKSFEKICRDIGVHNNVYPAYRYLCWITHPTTHGTLVYIAGNRQSVAPRHPRPVGLVGLMTHAVFWSRRTVDDLTVNHPYRDWLDGLAQSIDVMPRLPAPKSILGS